MHRILLVFAILAAAACAQAPDIGPPLTTAERQAPFPSLLPIATITGASRPTPRLSDATTAELDARVANLRARAALLTGPVVDPATRATMRAGVARAALR